MEDHRQICAAGGCSVYSLTRFSGSVSVLSTQKALQYSIRMFLTNAISMCANLVGKMPVILNQDLLCKHDMCLVQTLVH